MAIYRLIAMVSVGLVVIMLSATVQVAAVHVGREGEKHADRIQKRWDFFNNWSLNPVGQRTPSPDQQQPLKPAPDTLGGLSSNVPSFDTPIFIGAVQGQPISVPLEKSGSSGKDNRPEDKRKKTDQPVE